MRPSIHRPRQSGITLIESLVAIVVAALGILGILGVQMRTLADTQTTVRRSQAIRLIEDLGERMKVNPNALADLGAYVSAFSATPSAGDCKTKQCGRTELAAYDLGTWKQTVKDSLPLGQASIFLAPGETVAANRRLLGVMISWRENERDTAGDYKNNIDATKIRAADGSFSDGGGTAATCPADRTCDLQYGGPTQYFCPGS